MSQVYQADLVSVIAGSATACLVWASLSMSCGHEYALPTSALGTIANRVEDEGRERRSINQ